MKSDKFVSIIFVNYSDNEYRKELSRESLKSLQDSLDFPAEIIVVDNNSDSDFYLNELKEKRITHYIGNNSNLFFSYARNQGLKLADGDYISIVDNDIIYGKGWLSECISLLEDKLMATPMRCCPSHKKYTTEINGKKCNPFVGSNCWVMRREQFEDIGYFKHNIKSGGKWCKRYSRMGYKVAMTKIPMAEDLGRKSTEYRGYNKKSELKIIKQCVNFQKHIHPI